MNREPEVDLELSVAASEDAQRAVARDMDTKDPEDGEAALQKLIAEAKTKQ